MKYYFIDIKCIHALVQLFHYNKRFQVMSFVFLLVHDIYVDYILIFCTGPDYDDVSIMISMNHSTLHHVHGLSSAFNEFIVLSSLEHLMLVFNYTSICT